MTIGSASLSSSAFLTPALYALQSANNQLADSTLKLSTGSRLANPSDDVASFSISTRLQSQIVSINQGTRNAVQGGSLLQVAQGALQQISDIMDKMSTLSSQANTSSITSTDRSYLQAQFAQYLEEIDRIAGNTSFNNIKLLDGSLSGENKPTTSTAAATKGSATLAFTANPIAAQTVIFNGVTFTANTDFTVLGSTALTLDSLVTALNASTNTAISQASYARSNDSLVITAKSGGVQGNNFTIDKANSTTTFTVTGASTQVANLYTLSGGADDGLAVSSVTATGTIGDPIVNTQSQTSGSVTLNLSGAALNGETLNIDNGNGGLVNFTFATTASASTDIQIGASAEETLQNVIQTVSQYSGTNNFVTRQLDFRINGSSLIISNKTPGNPKDFAAAVPDITETLTNGSLSAATITGGTNTGINVSGVNNASFVGRVSGFTATYVGADSVTASITVGSSTYSAAITDTTPGSNTTVRFSSTSGGYFDVQLASGAGATVSNPTTATAFASHLNAAISGLTFYQARGVSNFSPTGTFTGASAKLQQSDFSDIRIDSINVTAPVSAGQDATIDVSINGDIYRASSGIGGTLGKYESLKFTNLTNANQSLTLVNGSSTKDFSTANLAATFESNLRSAFGLNAAGSGVSFQVGGNAADSVSVVVNTATTDKLFNGVTPDISSKSNAAAAQTLIDTAHNSVLASISNIGALLDRFQSVQDVNNKIVEGTTAANSNLADTDIAQESINYAVAALRLNAGIAIIAQTRNLQSSLLGVLQGSRGN